MLYHCGRVDTQSTKHIDLSGRNSVIYLVVVSFVLGDKKPYLSELRR